MEERPYAAWYAFKAPHQFVRPGERSHWVGIVPPNQPLPADALFVDKDHDRVLEWIRRKENRVKEVQGALL